MKLSVIHESLHQSSLRIQTYFLQSRTAKSTLRSSYNILEKSVIILIVLSIFQVSKFYHNSSDISSLLNGIDYLVASQRRFTSLKDWSVTLNSFVHTVYNANDSKQVTNLLAKLVNHSKSDTHDSTTRGIDLLLNNTLCHLKFKIYRTALFYSLLIWQRLEWRKAPRPDALRPFSLLASLFAPNFFWSC